MRKQIAGRVMDVFDYDKDLQVLVIRIPKNGHKELKRRPLVEVRWL